MKTILITCLSLLYDQEREVYQCPDCRGEFVGNAG